MLCALGVTAGVVLLGLSVLRFQFNLSVTSAAWYATASVITTVSLLLMRAPPGLRVGTSLLGLFCACLLLTVELSLEVLERSQFLRVQEAVVSRTGVAFDNRSIPAVVADLRKQGIAAVPSVVPKVLMTRADGASPQEDALRGPLFPLAGISHRPTVQLCVEGGRYPTYLSDEHGFHNPPGSWVAVP